MHYLSAKANTSFLKSHYFREPVLKQQRDSNPINLASNSVEAFQALLNSILQYGYPEAPTPRRNLPPHVTVRSFYMNHSLIEHHNLQRLVLLLVYLIFQRKCQHKSLNRWCPWGGPSHGTQSSCRACSFTSSHAQTHCVWVLTVINLQSQEKERILNNLLVKSCLTFFSRILNMDYNLSILCSTSITLWITTAIGT